jgi:hypothetical protein
VDLLENCLAKQQLLIHAGAFSLEWLELLLGSSVLSISWEQFDGSTPLKDPPHLKSWREEATTKIAKQEKRHLNGIIICTLWNKLKERNRRIVNNAHESAMQVALSSKEIEL